MSSNQLITSTKLLSSFLVRGTIYLELVGIKYYSDYKLE